MKKDFSNIKLFAMDVDGTLTDGKIYIGNDLSLIHISEPTRRS